MQLILWNSKDLLKLLKKLESILLIKTNFKNYSTFMILIKTAKLTIKNLQVSYLETHPQLLDKCHHLKAINKEEAAEIKMKSKSKWIS
jgi:hypothetical protein